MKAPRRSSNSSRASAASSQVLHVPTQSIRAMLVASIVATTGALSGVAFADTSAADSMMKDAMYEVSVRRDTYGVPHVRADNFGSLGYGEAYAAAEDHLCTISYELMRARGELSRYLGPGDQKANVAADAVIRALNIENQGAAALAAQSDEIREWLEGFSAGFNRYLGEHQGTRNSSWCQGAPWLVETRPVDFMNRMVVLALTLPRISGALATAQPPASEEKEEVAMAMPAEDLLAEAALVGMGSNGWAIGKERTENGRGVLLANPHYPWYGGNRFWEKHLTIPGKLDIYGVVTLGAPGVAIGFNESFGWTHTVSASQRLVIYRLALDENDPLRYRYGDEWKDIRRELVEVPVADGQGGETTVRHPVYFSHYGPMMVMPNMTWGEQYAYTVRDANLGNYDLLAQWKAMGEAKDLDAFIDAHRTYNAMPWVNTIAASADGRALYLDNSTVGNLSEASQQTWKASLEKDPLAAGLYQQRRMVLLNGSDPSNEWIDDGAPIAGTTPFEARPQIERKDFVFNSNDSYWLTSPSEPLTGYSILYGPTESARTLRTRVNARMLANTYGDAGEDDRFNITEVQEALFSNRGYAAELLLTDLVAVCESGSDLSQACEVLADYDGTLNLDSPGAVLFREWLTHYEFLDTVGSDRLFSEAFSMDSPVTTPATLGDRAEAKQALIEAVGVLEEAGLPLDATLRDTQFAYRAGEAIPIHGGNSYEGVANLQIAGNPSASPISGIKPEEVEGSRYLTSDGYPIVHGSSFILTLGFDDEGPAAQALLSYSQSGNPSSKHFKDQTYLYRDKQWRDIAFTEEEIAEAAVSLRMLRSRDER